MSALRRFAGGWRKCPRCRHRWRWHADAAEVGWRLGAVKNRPYCLAVPHCVCYAVRPS